MSQTYQPTRIDYLANEILLLVFIAAVPSLNSSNESSPLSKTQTPLNVSQVCHRWRQIALSSPQLWSSVNFDLRIYDDFEVATRATSAIAILVQRSADYPLYIRVILRFGGRENPIRGSPKQQDWEDLASRILKPLIRERHRWSFARIVTSPALWQEGFDDEEDWGICDTHILQDLQLGVLAEYFDGRPDLRRDGCFRLDISNIPSLESLVIADQADTELVLGTSLALPRLHTFQIKRRSCEQPVETVLRILAASPELKDFDWPMVAYNAFSEPRDGLPHIHLAQLRKLKMRYAHVPGIRTPENAIDKLVFAIDHLTMPNLVDFSLDLSDDRSYLDPVLGSIRDLFGRSTPPLKLLRLKFEEIEVPTLLDCLSHIPSLEELKLDVFDMKYVELIKALSVDPAWVNGVGAAPFCPNLKAMKVYFVQMRSTLSEITTMLQSRSPPDGQRYPKLVRDPKSDGLVTVSENNEAIKGRYGTAVLGAISLRDSESRSDENLVNDPIIAELVDRGLSICIWSSVDLDTHDADMDSDIEILSDTEADFFW